MCLKTLSRKWKPWPIRCAQSKGAHTTTRSSKRYIFVKSNSTLQHILLGGAIAVVLAVFMRALAPPPAGQFTPNGPPAPQFSLPRAGAKVGGGTGAAGNLALQDAVQGRKAVLINFWFYS